VYHFALSPSQALDAAHNSVNVLLSLNTERKFNCGKSAVINDAVIIIQFNSIYLCAKLNSPEANYKVSTGKKMRRVRRNR
jgi:hypothetical protein